MDQLLALKYFSTVPRRKVLCIQHDEWWVSSLTLFYNTLLRFVFQGISVSCIYCFFNSEVSSFIKYFSYHIQIFKNSFRTLNMGTLSSKDSSVHGGTCRCLGMSPNFVSVNRKTCTGNANKGFCLFLTGGTTDCTTAVWRIQTDVYCHKRELKILMKVDKIR